MKKKMNTTNLLQATIKATSLTKLILLTKQFVEGGVIGLVYVHRCINGSQLAKMKKSIPDMSLP